MIANKVPPPTTVRRRLVARASRAALVAVKPALVVLSHTAVSYLNGFDNEPALVYCQGQT